MYFVSFETFYGCNFFTGIWKEQTKKQVKKKKRTITDKQKLAFKNRNETSNTDMFIEMKLKTEGKK